MSNVKNVDVNSFNEEVLNSELPVLVDFGASWCAPCRLMEPVLEAIAAENANIKVVKVDVDECLDLCNPYNIKSVPTFLVFKDGKVVANHAGRTSKEKLLSLLK
jgi:thioredoxin 1